MDVDSQLTPTRRTSLAASAVESIRQAILCGELPAGVPVSQAMLAKKLGTSQGPVRDAILVLEREGLIRRTSTNRMIVVRLTRADIEELIQIRSVLEVLAVRLAIERAVPEDLARLDDNIRATEEAGATELGVDLDLQFHGILLEAARNRRLMSIWRELYPQLSVIMHRAFNSPPHSNLTAANAHRKLVELIRGREEARAVTFVETQMLELLEWAVKVFDPAS